MSCFPINLPLKMCFLSVVLVFLCFNSSSYAREQRKASSNFIDVDVNSLYTPEEVTCSNYYPRGKKEGVVSLEVVHRPRSNLKSDMLMVDQERVDSIHARLSGQSFSGDKAVLESNSANLPAQSGITIGSANYIVSVGLGTPQQKLSLIFDTGSDVTWTQCKRSYIQQGPIFNPASSSSYANIACGSNACNALNTAIGNPGCSSTCSYEINYADNSSSYGFLAKERLTLTSDSCIDDFVFGCGELNQGLFSGSAGLIGLGRTQLSLVSQVAPKYGNYFSYCLPPKSCSTGHLTLGHGGTTATDFSYTPLLNGTSSYYQLDLQSISVAGRKLPISHSVFSAKGTIIDSGTVITRLPQKAYSALSTAFNQYMSKYPSAIPENDSLNSTCYDLSNYQTVSVPKVTLYFGGGGVLDLPATGILIDVPSGKSKLLCLAFVSNYDDADGVGVVGNYQHKGFDVVYDVARRRIGFGPNAC